MASTLKCCIIGILLTVGVFGASCPVPSDQQTKVFSDSVNLVSTSKNGTLLPELQFNYIIEEGYVTDPQIAYGVNEFASQESPIMQIKIESSQVNKEGINFSVNSMNISQWKNLQINFITTDRQDMEFGNAEYINENNGITDEVFSVRYPLERNFSSIGLKVKPFIQGFDLESQDKQSIGVKIEDVDINGTTVYFSFANPHRVSLVRSLKLSLIVFNIHTPGVLYADGIIDQNYVSSTTEVYIPRHGINQLRTYMVGINSFHVSAAQPITIGAAIDQTFTLVLNLDRHQVDFISVSYLILSVVDCGSCNGYPLLFDGLCRIECPLGTRERNGECVPISCIDGYEVGPDGICIPSCPENQQFSEGRCVCISGFYWIGGRCTQCPEGTYFNYKKTACDSLCGYNAYYLQGRCFCNPGFFVVGLRCVACEVGTQYDYATSTCKSICGKNELYDGQRCVCDGGFYLINGVCDVCPTGTTYNTTATACDCLVNNEWNSGMSKCVPICTQFEHLINQTCVCKPEYYLIDGSCGKCPTNSLYSSRAQTCKCYYSFIKINGQCTCAEGKYLHKDNYCANICTDNQQWVNGVCQCAVGYSRDVSGMCYPPCGVFQERVAGICRCIDGYYKGVIGPCVQIRCPVGHQWNPQRRECRSVCPVSQIQVDGTCQCVPGYSRELIYGLCLPLCPSNQVRVNGVCQCSPGNKIIDGQCTHCPRYSQYVAGVCLCYNGRPPIDGSCQELSCPDPNHVYDSITKSCRCRGPLVWLNGKCSYIKGCPQNEYWCGSSCACNYGYSRQNGVCVLATGTTPTCPQNSRFNGANCVCDAGYYPIRQNVCGVCERGSYWNGYRCSNDDSTHCAQGYFWTGTQCTRGSFGCGINQYWDGTSCRCKKGYHLISGSCSKCSYGTFFDGNSCTNTYSKSCSDPYQFWNGQDCVCIVGYFPYGDSCVRCPANTEWNGVCCEYPKDYVSELTVANGY